MTDLIRRMDAIQACQVGPSDEWSKATKSGYAQAATDCQRNILRINPAAIHTPALNAEAVKVKPMDMSDDLRGQLWQIVLKMTACDDDGCGQNNCACMARYSRILAAIETTPDPRDAVIARLVDVAQRLDEYWDMSANAVPSMHRKIKAALAAAKEVMK